MPKCWNCDNPITWEEGKLIYDCECGVSNDFTPYNSLTETQIKEIKVPFEDTKQEGGYIKLPKEGKSEDFSVHGAITKIEKVENAEHKKGKFNFTKKVIVTLPNGAKASVDEDQNYFYLITFSDGSKLSISSWSPFFALKNAEVAEGDILGLIDHQEKGAWIINKA